MKLKDLTEEQKSFLPVYRDEGIALGWRTEPINRERAIAALHEAYECASLRWPGDDTVEFFDSPAAIKQAGHNFYWCYGNNDVNWLWFHKFFHDKCGLVEETKQLRGLWNVARQCHWYQPCDEAVFVSDFPREMHGILIPADNPWGWRKVFHNVGGPAFRYADGFEGWFLFGVEIRDKRYYAKEPDWDAHWLLDEHNAEMRKIIIQVLGYDRITEELNSKSIDSWREYELLRIDENTDVDVEPMQLLKMTCSSTGMIHVIRVPPNINNARHAARWINHGTDPDDFIVET